MRQEWNGGVENGLQKIWHLLAPKFSDFGILAP